MSPDITTKLFDEVICGLGGGVCRRNSLFKGGKWKLFNFMDFGDIHVKSWIR
jgi:hypothetical protein